MRQGDSGDFLYVIGEGILDVEAVRGELAPIRDRLAPGEVFGEVSLLTGQRRTASVTAALDFVVYEIHREDLDPIVKRRPEVAEGLAAVMAERQARNDKYLRAPCRHSRPRATICWRGYGCCSVFRVSVLIKPFFRKV